MPISSWAWHRLKESHTAAPTLLRDIPRQRGLVILKTEALYSL